MKIFYIYLFFLVATSCKLTSVSEPKWEITSYHCDLTGTDETSVRCSDYFDYEINGTHNRQECEKQKGRWQTGSCKSTTLSFGCKQRKKAPYIVNWYDQTLSPSVILKLQKECEKNNQLWIYR
jgi:hypothetical protein